MPPDPKPRTTPAAAWLFVAALAGFIAWLLACTLHAERSHVADDAFITYGYARNLAEGFGLRYNASDAEPTWGATSLLHTLVSAAAIRAGAHPLIASRVLGIATFLALGALFGVVGARVARCSTFAGVVAGLVVCGLWGLAPESATHLASGMDCLLFTLVHGCAAAWATSAASSRTRGRVGLAPLALLVLARPEGALLALGYVGAVALVRGEGKFVAARWIELAPLALAVLGLVVGLWLWQWSYYGQPHPNAYYVKVHSAIFGSSGAMLPGLDTTVRFLALRWMPLLALAGLLAAAVHTQRALVRAALWLLAPSATLAVAYSNAIHEMAAGFRYEYPALAPLALALVVGLCALARRSTASWASTLAVAGLIVPLLTGAVSPRWLVWLAHPRSLALGGLSEIPTDNALARLGLDLAETGLGQRAAIVLSGAGQVPFHSRLRALDWIGLNTARFSGREPLEPEELWREIDALAPDLCFSILPPAAPGSRSAEADPNWNSPLVQSVRRGRGSALFEHWERSRLERAFWAEMLWLRDTCEFAAAYKLGEAWGGDWWVLVYVRRDSPHRERLLEVLGASRRADRDSDLSAVYPFDPRALAR